MTRVNPGTPPSPTPSNALAQPAHDTRETRTESNDDSDLGLRQRIRQAAMADGSL